MVAPSKRVLMSDDEESGALSPIAAVAFQPGDSDADSDPNNVPHLGPAPKARRRLKKAPAQPTVAAAKPKAVPLQPGPRGHAGARPSGRRMSPRRSPQAQEAPPKNTERAAMPMPIGGQGSREDASVEDEMPEVSRNGAAAAAAADGDDEDDEDIFAGAAIFRNKFLMESSTGAALLARDKSGPRVTPRESYHVVQAKLGGEALNKLITTISEAEFATSGNKWLPQKWRKRGQNSKRGAEEEDVRTWLCPFHKETGCMARLQEVRHFNDMTFTLERAGFDHNDHTNSRRCASVKI